MTADDNGPARRSTRAVKTPPAGHPEIGTAIETAAATSTADDLRVLIARAETVLGELRGLIDTHRQSAIDASDTARGAAFSAGQQEVARFTQFFGGEMRAALDSFDGMVNRARQAVLASLRPRTVSVDARSGWVTVQFDGDVPSQAVREPR
jgi:hypothetical protein